MHKYRLGFQVETEANFMNLIFVLQGHERKAKPRANFKSNIEPVYEFGYKLCKAGWLMLNQFVCVQDGVKLLSMLEPISLGLHPQGLNQIKKST